MLQPVLYHPTLLVIVKNPLMTRNPLLGKRPSNSGNNMKKQCVFFYKMHNQNFASMNCNNGKFAFYEMQWWKIFFYEMPQ